MKFLDFLNGSPLWYSCLENAIEEPGGLQSMKSQRVRYDLATEHPGMTTYKHVQTPCNIRTLRWFNHLFMALINMLAMHGTLFFP